MMKVVLVLFTIVVFARAQEQQKMTFETPKLSEEEQHSQHTPASFEIQCDACTVIAYKVEYKLNFLLFSINFHVGNQGVLSLYFFFYQSRD